LEPVEDGVHHPMRLRMRVEEVPRRVVEERASASRTVKDAHLAGGLRHHQRSALGAAPRMERAQGVLFALPQPLPLLVVQLAQALGVLAREVFVLEVARLLDGHRRPCNYFRSATPPSCSSSAWARSCCG